MASTLPGVPATPPSHRTIAVDDLPGTSAASRFEGHAYGSSVSLFLTHVPPGGGPALHRHPYDETFVVEAGRARFTVDGATLETGPGRIVVVPAGRAHRFESLGPGDLRLVAIHAAPVMEQEWVETVGD